LALWAGECKLRNHERRPLSRTALIETLMGESMLRAGLSA
jgi:hypothetical protein